MRLRSRLTVRRQDTKGDEMMTEERATYATDEVTQLRRQNRELSEKLDRQIAAWNANGDALTAHVARQAQRIAELEQEVIGVRLSASVMKGAYIEASAEATELKEDIAQLTAQLAAVPVDALRRYYRGTVYTPTAAQQYDYMPDDYDTDSIAIHRWLFPQEGAA